MAQPCGIAKPHRLRLLTGLCLLLVAVSLTGHFVADALCVLGTAVDGLECAADNGRVETVPLAADLHSAFDLPAPLPFLSLMILAFILIAAAAPYLPWSPAPTPPPPKTSS